MLLRNCVLTIATVEPVIVQHCHRTSRTLVLGSYFSSLSSIDRWQVRCDSDTLKLSFVEEHGHANVAHRALQSWIYTQRRALTTAATSRDEDDHTQNTKQSSEPHNRRREQLESLGVRPLTSYSDAWDEQYAKLEKYYQLHGHVNLGRTEDAKLYHWVQRQRKLYRQKLPGSLPEERIHRLQKLGLSFDPCQDIWLAKLEELKKYKQEHGDCMVPLEYPTNPTLGIWVDTQRQQFIIHDKGGWTKLTEERKQLLDAIGFVWKAHDAKWQVKFEELQDHVRVNGFGHYPPATSTIGYWLMHQKRMYRKHKEGHKVTLTQERMQKLKSLGFLRD
jgi:hypothetical protein